MKVINIHEAKTHFSKLVQTAAAGKELVIGRAGKPLVRLVPFEPKARPDRIGGQLRRKIKIAADCWEPDHEMAALLTGGPVFPPPAMLSARVAGAPPKARKSK